jgi:hypothetical protein
VANEPGSEVNGLTDSKLVFSQRGSPGLETFLLVFIRCPLRSGREYNRKSTVNAKETFFCHVFAKFADSPAPADEPPRLTCGNKIAPRSSLRAG